MIQTLAVIHKRSHIVIASYRNYDNYVNVLIIKFMQEHADRVSS